MIKIEILMVKFVVVETLCDFKITIFEIKVFFWWSFCHFYMKISEISCDYEFTMFQIQDICIQQLLCSSHFLVSKF
jgi:hypothetical protein